MRIQLPTYYEVLELLNKEETKIIAKVLKKIQNFTNLSGGKIVDNIRTDYKISSVALKGIIDSLILNNGADRSELLNSFKSSCRIHKLDGPQIKSDYIKKLGRVETLHMFKSKLKDIFISDEDVNRIILKLQKREKLTPYERSCVMSTRICWYTWNNDSTDDDPLYFVNDASDKVLAAYANLGLPHNKINETNVLIRINKPVTAKLRFPTIADAELHGYFKPPHFSEKSGFTEIWHEDEISDKTINLKRRPEAVDKYYELGYYDSIEICSKEKKIFS